MPLPWEEYQPQGKKPWDDFKADGGSNAAPQAEGMSWSDVPMRALQNTPQSAINFGSGILQSVLHPIQTAGTLGDLGAGALREGARSVLPTSVFNAIDSVGNQDAANRASQTASAVGAFYKNRYGSGEGIKHAIAEDPIGVAGDLAAVLSGGETIAAKLPGMAAISEGLGTAAKLSNPLTPVASLAKKGVVLGGKYVAAPALGLTTGTSADAIKEAYRAGRTGGDQKAAFLDNMRGNVEPEQVIGEAKGAMQNITDARQAQYQKDMAAINADKTPINMQPIIAKFNDVVASAYHNGVQKASDQTIGKLKEMGNILGEWVNNPKVQDAAGLDALKQRIDNLMPNVLEPGNAGRVVTSMRNAVKDEIVKQAPTYGEAMQNFEKSKTAQDEIAKSLSLNRRASNDTILRKLQSVTRNNANTNYGARAKSADELTEAGATTLKPALAGQALNTIVPRGIQGGILGSLLSGGTVAAAGGLLNPATLAAGLLASPRLIGETSQMAGSVANAIDRIPVSMLDMLLRARLAGDVANIGSGSRR